MDEMKVKQQQPDIFATGTWKNGIFNGIPCPKNWKSTTIHFWDPLGKFPGPWLQDPAAQSAFRFNVLEQDDPFERLEAMVGTLWPCSWGTYGKMRYPLVN